MTRSVETSVADPVYLGILDPDSLVRGSDPTPDRDPHQAKIVGKTFIPTVF